MKRLSQSSKMKFQIKEYTNVFLLQNKKRSNWSWESSKQYVNFTILFGVEVWTKKLTRKPRLLKCEYREKYIEIREKKWKQIRNYQVNWNWKNITTKQLKYFSYIKRHDTIKRTAMKSNGWISTKKQTGFSLVRYTVKTRDRVIWRIKTFWRDTAHKSNRWS